MRSLISKCHATTHLLNHPPPSTHRPTPKDTQVGRAEGLELKRIAVFVMRRLP